MKDLKRQSNFAKEIAKDVYSIQFALACDFLKECGCTWLSKPDIHILKICGTIFNENYKKDTIKDLERCVNNMHEIVKNINKRDATDYKLDKMFWLISSMKFYLDTEKLINRDNLCTEIKEIMSTKLSKSHHGQISGQKVTISPP